MTLLIAIFCVLLGLALGSFLNVCISRLPHHESVVHPRSRCPECRAPIRAADNIPVLSWILLHRRCRSCHAAIPWRYPMIEAAAATLFLLCFLRFGPTLRGVGAAVLCWLLLGLAATDAETLLLPDALTLPGIVLGVVYSAFNPYSGLAASRWLAAAYSLLWAACAAAFILLIRGTYGLVRRREGMGLGDAKLLAMIAAWLGPWPTVLTLFIGVLLAAIFGVASAARHRLRRRTGSIDALKVPLGAFLSAAAILALFAGQDAIYWYMGLFR